MSEDRFTETIRESWFSRIGGAFKGIVVGVILSVVAFVLLFTNEGRAVKRYKTLKEGGGAVVSVAADRVAPEHTGKLIHVTGKADTDAVLTDSVFGVSTNALMLNRIVEMYQWKESTQSETRKKLGGGSETVKTYSYSKGWSKRLIDSADFKKPTGHENPGAMPYRSTEQMADRVGLEVFALPPSLVGSIDNFTPLVLGGETPMPEALVGKGTWHEGGVYIGNDPVSPRIGDLRVKFEVALPTEVSVIAKQVGESFAPYEASAGGTIELLQMGIHPAVAMIEKAQAGNKALSWMLRFLGFILMLVGLGLILRPLSVMADVLPMLGSVVGAGTGIIALLSAAVLTLITVAVAWMVYRPLLGMLLVAVATGLTVAIRSKLKAAKAAA